MSVSLSEYEDFLRKFRNESDDPVLIYWTDLIHVMRWNANPLVENRFKGGLTWWGVWALLKVLSPHGNPVVSDTGEQKPGSLQNGYRLLPTPAHRDTLMPLIEAADPGTVRIYGEEAGIPGLLQIPLDFPSNLKSLGFRQRFFSLLKAIKSHHRIAGIMKRCIPSGQHLPAGFHPRLIEQIFAMEIGLARLRRYETPLKSLYLTYELSPDSKALVLWARETGADVIHVMHGQRLPTYQLTLATDLILLSKIDEAWFRSRVDPAVRIHTTGHPRLEKIRKMVPPPSRNGRTRPRIAFFSQPAEGDYTPQRRDADYQILEGLVGKADVRIRLHPREDPETALLALQQLDLGFVELSQAGLEQDLAWCDAIASSWSTVSVEAAACDRGVFWSCATPELYEAPRELRANGIGVLIQDSGQWETHLNHWKADGWASPVVVPESRLHELGIIGTAKNFE